MRSYRVGASRQAQLALRVGHWVLRKEGSHMILYGWVGQLDEAEQGKAGQDKRCD